MDKPAANQELSRMISGYWISQAVYVAAKLRIADHPGLGPQSIAVLADESRVLLEASGFSFSQIIPTDTGVSILEGHRIN